MASIQFKVLDDANSLNTISGSGLGFYGSTFGASVSTTSYQDSTYVTSADGLDEGTSARNVKYVTPSSCYGGVSPASGGLFRLNSSDTTLTINFNHSSAVKVQNAQLRIFDRLNPDSPASGVITKVAEVFNFGGGNPNITGWFASPGADFVASSGCAGDALWWGSSWPSGNMLSESANASFVRPGYTNSVGVRFTNFTDYQINASTASGNPHPSISGLTYPGSETVGGSGIIVPLMDSPGPTGAFIATGIYDGSISPKFAQYISTTSQVNLIGLAAGYDITDAATLSGTYGGTGYATDHTWYVALSARPLSIGSKTAYGLYLSLEYL